MKAFSSLAVDGGVQLSPSDDKSTVPTRILTRPSFHYLRQNARKIWLGFRRRCLQRALRTYNFDKHVLDARFHPIVGEATMRAARGEIERNRFPFHVSACQERVFIDLPEPIKSRLSAKTPLCLDYARDAS